jgi:hypothetical protein
MVDFGKVKTDSKHFYTGKIATLRRELEMGDYQTTY